MHYFLFYEAGDDYVSRRGEFRSVHLQKAWQASERGELVLGGALANPVDGAVLLFKGDSPEIAEKFARNDPYVTSGMVKRWYVREWTTVAGEDAANPIRPNAAAAKKQASSDSSVAARETSSSQSKGILRMWKGRTSTEKAGDYVRHVTGKVFPGLRGIEGYRGEFLLRRAVQGAVEFAVLTLWDSMEAVCKFAGAQPSKAVVEPAARAVLSDFDDSVTHFEIVQSARVTPK